MCEKVQRKMEHLTRRKAMRYDEEDLYWACLLLFIVGLMFIGPAVGAIMAARDNNATIEVCKELCVAYDKRPQCLICCELEDWRWRDSHGCH